MVVKTPCRERTMSTGIVVRVYPVPETLVWRLLPGGEPEPEVPLHEMATKVGLQARLAKEGDPEWEPYLRRHALWEKKKDQLDTDARIVLAMRESEDQPGFNWPEVVEPPGYLKSFIADGELVWPESSAMQKAIWFRSAVGPSAEDVSGIMDDTSILSGMDESLVEAFRQKVFGDLRNRLLGTDAVPEDTLQPALAGDSSGAEVGPSSPVV